MHDDAGVTSDSRPSHLCSARRRPHSRRVHDRYGGLPGGSRIAEVRGAPFETDVFEFPWGYLAVFRDPDGNRLQLREVLSDA